MTRFFKFTTAALTLFIASFATPVNAAVSYAGDFDPGESFTAVFSASGDIADGLDFLLNQDSIFGISLNSLDLSFNNTDIFKINGLFVDILDKDNSFLWKAQFPGDNNTHSLFLESGNYRLNFGGTATGIAGGIYAASFQVTAVPEPETYALLLAGLITLGFAARRRIN